MASLKGKLVDDGLRASVYGMLRIPLNVFVVLALSTTKEGTGTLDPTPHLQLLTRRQAKVIATWYSQLAAHCYWLRLS